MARPDSPAPATLIVEREQSTKHDPIRRYRVQVDDQEVGRLRHGERCEVQLAPGRHEVQVRIDWTGSPVRMIDVRDGDVIRLLVSHRGGMLGRHRYLYLEHIDS